MNKTNRTSNRASCSVDKVMHAPEQRLINALNLTITLSFTFFFIKRFNTAGENFLPAVAI
jgi:hypothetical protein